MSFFQLFLPVTAFLLSLVSIGVAYWVITRCKESEFIPTFYFIAFSLVAVMAISMVRASRVLLGSEIINYVLVQDLMIAWTALFLFGALWQSYETSICVVPAQLNEN